MHEIMSVHDDIKVEAKLSGGLLGESQKGESRWAGDTLNAQHTLKASVRAALCN